MVGAVDPARRSASVQVLGRLVLDEHVTPGRIIIEGGRIAAIEPDPNVRGPFVCPGFVDVHVHGWGGHDAMAGRGALDQMARGLLRHGVTSFLPTAVTAPMPTLVEFARSVRAWMPESPADGAEPLGFALEGPFITRAPSGPFEVPDVQNPADVPDEALQPLLDGLRLITVAPELPGSIDLIRRLTGRGIRVALGHSRATAAQAADAYAAGASSTTHLFNEMSGVHHHEPGLAAAALANDEAWVEFIADGQHVDPVLWPLILRTKPADRLILVSDAIALAGTGVRRSSLGGHNVVVRDGACRLESDGRVVGSVIALDDALRNLVRAGVELPRAVAAASRHPAALVGSGDRGRLAVGARADLVELDDELGVVRLMRAGQWVLE